MSDTVRWGLEGAVLLANASQTIASAATTAFDFGTPNDIDLEAETGYPHAARLMLVMSATRAAGTTDTITFVVQDAPDNAGNIGTPATAVTEGTLLAMAADSGAVNAASLVGVKLQPGRTWIRVAVTHAGGGTDSFQCHAALYAVPSSV